jgi:hypothetical protein
MNAFHIVTYEVGEIDEETGIWYYFNKYLKGTLRHWNKEVKAEEL